MNQLYITRTFKAEGLQIGFVKTEVSKDCYANDYYYIVDGQEPVGPYADEEDTLRGYYFANN